MTRWMSVNWCYDCEERFLLVQTKNYCHIQQVTQVCCFRTACGLACVSGLVFVLKCYWSRKKAFRLGFTIWTVDNFNLEGWWQNRIWCASSVEIFWCFLLSVFKYSCKDCVMNIKWLQSTCTVTSFVCPFFLGCFVGED